MDKNKRPTLEYVYECGSRSPTPITGMDHLFIYGNNGGSVEIAEDADPLLVMRAAEKAGLDSRMRAEVAKEAGLWDDYVSNILITGAPHSGKTTLLERLLENIPKTQGFTTPARYDASNTERTGFWISYSNGYDEASRLLAGVEIESDVKVSRYGVDLAALREALSRISHIDGAGVLYADEIGQMELHSKRFRKFVRKCLDSDRLFLGVVSQAYSDDFTKEILSRPDVKVVDINPKNRIGIYHELKQMKQIAQHISPFRFMMLPENGDVDERDRLLELYVLGRRWEYDTELGLEMIVRTPDGSEWTLQSCLDVLRKPDGTNLDVKAKEVFRFFNLLYCEYCGDFGFRPEDVGIVVDERIKRASPAAFDQKW
jgi:nucleoside-triphosphatase